MNGSFQCLKLAGRPGRDAKWKEGGTGLKAEMERKAAAAAAAGGAWDAPLLMLLEPTSQKLTEIWRKNFNEAEKAYAYKCTQKLYRAKIIEGVTRINMSLWR